PCRVVTIPRPPGAARSPSPTLFRSAPAHVLARELPAQRERGPRRDRTQAAQAAIEGALELAPERVVVEREDACRLGIGQRPHDRSEEHTSELQSRENLVCRLLHEKK